MNTIALAILGVVLGHPDMPGDYDPDLESLDNAFDDAAYTRGWRPWGWEPGHCVNCMARLDWFLTCLNECSRCGWLQ